MARSFKVDAHHEWSVYSSFHYTGRHSYFADMAYMEWNVGLWSAYAFCRWRMSSSSSRSEQAMIIKSTHKWRALTFRACFFTIASPFDIFPVVFFQQGCCCCQLTGLLPIGGFLCLFLSFFLYEKILYSIYILYMYLCMYCSPRSINASRLTVDESRARVIVSAIRNVLVLFFWVEEAPPLLDL